MSATPRLTIDGAVARPLVFTFADLAAFPAPAQIDDVSRFHPTRKGDGVALDAIFERAQLQPDARYVTLHADRDDFHVSVSLEALRGQGIVVYRLGPYPLAPEFGGPFRLLIRDPAHCQAGELDDCSNIKFLSRIELSHDRGRDTRPTTEPEHEALHESQAEKDRADEPSAL